MRTSIQHPSHHVPDEVAVSIRKLREVELATLARQDEIAKLARPNEEERRLLIEDQVSTAHARGINADMLQRRREVNTRRFERVARALEGTVAIRQPFELVTLDDKPTLPPPTDPTFWWAKTDWWLTEGISADSRSDGLHFMGGIVRHNGDLHTENFGAVALFELQAERIPLSLSRRWLSTPHVELFGELIGNTGDSDIFTGDIWSKCWMHRDQQLFQMGFGAGGPVPIILGQAHESEILIFEENRGRSEHVGLRGFQWMPPVTFGNINPAHSLWARVEVRFDIQTEGEGALFAPYPEVLLRTFQWQLTPL
jgi:hypothetical protein